jgi:site-specific recombinase XerD
MLKAWVGPKRRGWLFPGQDGDHLGTRVIQYHCRRYRKAAGITRRVTPHTFRHSCAVHNLTSGAPITYVQQRLGHANLAVTGIYTQLVDRERARITRETELAI